MHHSPNQPGINNRSMESEGVMMKIEDAVRQAIKSSSRVKKLKGGRFYCFKFETLSKICHKAAKLMEKKEDEKADT